MRPAGAASRADKTSAACTHNERQEMRIGEQSERFSRQKARRTSSNSTGRTSSDRNPSRLDHVEKKGVLEVDFLNHRKSFRKRSFFSRPVALCLAFGLCAQNRPHTQGGHGDKQDALGNAGGQGWQVRDSQWAHRAGRRRKMSRERSAHHQGVRTCFTGA